MKDVLTVIILYYLSATGALTAYEYLGDKFYILSLPLMVIFYFLFREYKEYIKLSDCINLSICIAPLLILYLVTGYGVSNSTLYIKRIEGGFAVTFLVSLIALALIRKKTATWLFQVILGLTLASLILTLIYKYHFGFWDRGIRFFINGPIVFSWFMGLGIIIALHLGMNGKITKIQSCAIVAILSAAMSWAESKGPLVMVFIVFLKLIIDHTIIISNMINDSFSGIKLLLRVCNNARRNNDLGDGYGRESLPLVLTVAFVFLLTIVAVSTFTPSTLLDRIIIINFSDLLQSGGEATEPSSDPSYGSIGIRIDMWLTAWNYFLKNPIMGIGPTNFSLDINYGHLLYPHNLILELASELGLLGIISLFILLTYIWSKTTYFGRLILLYFFVGLMISGDISYLRLLVVLPIALMIIKQGGFKYEVQ